MTRRIPAAVALVLGLIAIALGIASATAWRSSDVVAASMPAPTAPVVLVEPGVLAMVADEVTVTATAASPDNPVTVALAPKGDAVAWLGPAAHELVTGLASWTQLATERVDGDPSVPNPAGSDLWLEEQTGTGSLEATFTPEAGQIVLLAATDGTAPAPRLTLTWQVPVQTPYLVPLLIVGGVLVLLGLALLRYPNLWRRGNLPEREGVPRSGRGEPAAAPPTEASLTDTAGLSRRERRELERRLRLADPRMAPDGPVARTAGMVGAGIVPGVANPEHHRALRHVVAPESAPPAVAADARDMAGPAAGSAVVPGVAQTRRYRPSDLADRIAADRLAESGPAAGSAIVPGSRRAAPGRNGAAEPDPEQVSWRALWGFGPGTEEQ